MAEVKTEEKIVLPTKPVPAARKSPKNLILFSKPKTGKTSLLAQLPDCLILDFENGTDFLDAMKLTVGSIGELKKIGRAIKEAGFPYKYIAVDTVTKLEEMCIPFAEQIYSKTNMGRNWFTPGTGGKAEYGAITNMPNGSGYYWLREAYTQVTDYISTLAPRIIWSGHVKDAQINKDGAEFIATDLDLTGKIKRMTTSASDAIGYLYRKGDKNILSFKTSEEVSCGARPDHLKNKQVVISEIVDGKIVTHWDEIFID